MGEERVGPDDVQVIADINRTQIERFTRSDPRCRALELPEGLMLRYNLSRSLYFCLRTGVKEGRIVSQVFASDSPYDRQKAHVGEVRTPLFEAQADAAHLDRVQRMLYSWVEFVKDEVDAGRDFTRFDSHIDRD